MLSTVSWFPDFDPSQIDGMQFTARDKMRPRRPNSLVDVENDVDVEATTAIRQAEVLAAKRIANRTKTRCGFQEVVHSTLTRS